MSDIERRLRELGDNIRRHGSGAGSLPPRQRRRIKVRRALFAVGGAVTAVALVATASYGVGLVRDQRDIAPADERSSTLIRFDRSGGFTSDHHVLTIQRDGSALLESPGSRGLVEPVEFELEADLMATLQDAIDQVDWALLNEQRTPTNVMVADGYLIEISHDGYDVVTESAAEPRSARPLIDLLNTLIEERLNGSLTAEPTLTLSDTTLSPGDVVDLQIEAPDTYTWGALTGLDAQHSGDWERLYHWATYIDGSDGPLTAFRKGGVGDIGYSGSATFQLRIPQLESGRYRITKDFIRDLVEGESLEERTVVAEVGFDVVAASADQENFAALWPEDSSAEAQAACAEANGDPHASRHQPMAVARAFAVEVLGWDPGVRLVPRRAEEGRRDIEIRRSEDDRGEPAQDAAVRVYMSEVADDCWSVGSVSRLPDKRPTGVGISVRGRSVEVGFATLGAATVSFEIGHGPHTLTSEPAGRDGRITSRLTYAPNDTGHFLILFKDEDGRVFSAAGGPLPAGDFGAG